ncbi:hypothetical protein BDV93DRAFT_521846 [Ceratobasidium sp. AG-I]|nr:hypothetical protein BDV93DRAFT_521846 [Ceratobasidium sp. AG-I]
MDHTINEANDLEAFSNVSGSATALPAENTPVPTTAVPAEAPNPAPALAAAPVEDVLVQDPEPRLMNSLLGLPELR